MSWNGKDLRKLRLELGWSQAELGRRLSMNAARVQSLENDECSFDSDCKLQLDRMSQHLRDYSRTLQNSSRSEKHLKEKSLNQISHFDLECIE